MYKEDNLRALGLIKPSSTGRRPNGQPLKNANKEKVQIPVRSAKSAVNLSRQHTLGLLQPAFGKVLNEIEQYRQFEQAKIKTQGRNTSLDIGHFLLIGPPGTGKTHGAEVLAKHLYNNGFCKKSIFRRVSRKDLVGEFIGSTALKTQKVLDETRGGVLLVDEAYTLFKGKDNQKDFGLEALETLMLALECNEHIILMAGYKKEMIEFLDLNPGLEDRFKWRIEFGPIGLSGLMEFAESYAGKKGYQFTSEGKQLFRKAIEQQEHYGHFAYLRSVRSFIEKIIMKKPNLYELLGDRCLLTEIGALDMQHYNQHDRRDQMEEALEKLERLTGLSDVKQLVKGHIQMIDYRNRRNGLGLPQSDFSMHMVFSGNPGTGKTTVARLIGQILGAMGILKDGHLVECSREALVAPHSGHTAIKTKKLLQQALGGILLIDEAYSLVNGAQDAFGKEALDTLVKFMEDNKGQLVVIFTGYQTEMTDLFSMNPGLESRVATWIVFPDYSNEELKEILIHLFEQEKYLLLPEATVGLDELIVKWIDKKGRSGNGRAMRNLFQEIIINHASRMEHEEKDAELSLIRHADIEIKI